MTHVELPTAEASLALVSHLRQRSAEFGALVDAFADAALALRHVGLAQWQMGRHGSSVEALLAALSLRPENSEIWRDLASVYNASANIHAAESAIRKSLLLDPGHAQSWLILAGICDQRHDVVAAEAAYRRTVALDATIAAAHFGLGLLHFKQKDFEQAQSALSTAVDRDPENGLARACLGHVLFIRGDFEGSAQAFDAAARLGPLDPESGRKRARALTFQAMIDGSVEQAILDYPALAHGDREDLALIIRDAFSILSASGHLEAAAELGRIRLAEQPDDPIRRYLLDAVSGTAVTVAPPDYIESYFDRFAPQFDERLVETLHYVGPAVLFDRVRQHRTRFTRILDLGCGTGLAAEALSSCGALLIGVDLSSGMLAEAAKKGRYTQLVKSEIVAFLSRSEARFDLIFAADVLIYFGDLSVLLAAAARTLVSGGLLALTLEIRDDADFTLLPSGRFAHAPHYLSRLVAADFLVLDFIEHDLRLEAGVRVRGLYTVLQHR